MKPTFFADQYEFRKWLEKNHESETNLLVGFYKVASGKPSMNWPASVDQALCYGWIDGVRKSIDNESYTIRFTPRKPTSIWSNVNIKKVADLSEKGLMMPAGMAAFKRRSEEKSGIYAFENELKILDKVYEDQFKKNKKAWEFFEKQSAYYKKRMIHHIMTPKQEKTRIGKLEKIIEASAAGKRID